MENQAERKFQRERHLTELLMRRLGVAATYLNPHAGARDETGVDVIAITEAGRIGVQVTELDPGDQPGRMRAAERKAADAARKNGNDIYWGWGQNDVSKVVAGIRRGIQRKSRMSHALGFQGVWLLASCGIPDLGSVTSTIVVTPWLTPEALTDATAGDLTRSCFDRAYVHSILGVEAALYEWTRERGIWMKAVAPLPPGTEAPSFFEVRDDQEWLADPEGKCQREIAKVLREIREGRIG